MYKLFTALACLLLCTMVRAQDQDPALPCVEQLKNDPRVQILVDKIPTDVSKGQSLEVLSNKTKPTPKEKAALSIMASEGERCFELGADWRRQHYPPEGLALLATYRVDMIATLADLYAGKITFGEAAKIRAKTTTDLKNNVDSLVRDLQAKYEEKERQQREVAALQDQAERQVRQQREAIAQQQRFAQQQAQIQQEESRRQMALQILMNQRPPQIYQPMQPYQMQTPIRTNCSSYGNQTNCTTR